MMKNNLKLVRQKFGLSQEKFAELLDVSQGNISHCERQIQEVSPELARKIVDAGAKKGIRISFDDIYFVGRRSAKKAA